MTVDVTFGVFALEVFYNWELYNEVTYALYCAASDGRLGDISQLVLDVGGKDGRKLGQYIDYDESALSVSNVEMQGNDAIIEYTIPVTINL